MRRKGETEMFYSGPQRQDGPHKARRGCGSLDRKNLPLLAAAILLAFLMCGCTSPSQPSSSSSSSTTPVPSTSGEVTATSSSTSTETTALPTEPFADGILALKAAEDAVEDSFAFLNLLSDVDVRVVTDLKDNRDLWAAMSNNLEVKRMLSDYDLSWVWTEGETVTDSRTLEEESIWDKRARERAEKLDNAEKGSEKVDEELQAATSVQSSPDASLRQAAIDLTTLIRAEVAAVKNYVAIHNQASLEEDALLQTYGELLTIARSGKPFLACQRIINNDLLHMLDKQIALQPQITAAASQVVAARRASIAKREEIAALLSPPLAEEFRGFPSFFDSIVSE
jgi:hypothetical protein